MKTPDLPVSGDIGARSAPKWLLTFADLMALLFALFVLLLSFSEVDSDSFKKNADRLAEAFNQAAPQAEPKTEAVPDRTAPATPSRQSSLRSTLLEIRTADRRRRVIEDLEFALTNEIADGSVVLNAFEDHAVIRFPAARAFAAGSAELNDSAGATVDRVARILAGTKGAIVVSGHTDDRPISTDRFRSNWDLSTARAASVVHRLLGEAGIAPARMSAEGHADTRPLADNATAEGRVANRRVEIRIQIANEPADEKK